MVVQKSRNLGEAGPGAGPGSVTAAKVRRGDIRHAIVVRTVNKVQRKDGMVVKFDDNACALIGKNGEPIGTRINGKLSLQQPGCCHPMLHRSSNTEFGRAGVVGAELRDKQWSKILSLASMHV